MKLIIC